MLICLQLYGFKYFNLNHVHTTVWVKVFQLMILSFTIFKQNVIGSLDLKLIMITSAIRIEVNVFFVVRYIYIYIYYIYIYIYIYKLYIYIYIYNQPWMISRLTFFYKKLIFNPKHTYSNFIISGWALYNQNEYCYLSFMTKLFCYEILSPKISMSNIVKLGALLIHLYDILILMTEIEFT